MNASRVLCLLLLALLASAPPCLAKGEPLDVMQAMQRLKKAKNDFSPKENGYWKRDVREIFSRNPPGSGWSEWGSLCTPSWEQAYWLLQTLDMARSLGLLDGKSVASRKVLWELAGRVRDVRASDQAWLDKARRWFTGRVRLPEHWSALKHMELHAAGVRKATHELAQALRRQALKHGPPPKGRPVLAEGYKPYVRLKRDIERIMPKAQALERTVRPFLARDWPAYGREIEAWARESADILCMFKIVGVKASNPAKAMDFPRIAYQLFTGGYESIMDTSCDPEMAEAPCRSVEKPVADQFVGVADRFYDPTYDLLVKRYPELAHVRQRGVAVHGFVGH